MTTSAVQADLSSSWKQEVNRRLAEHKSRKGLSAVEQQAPVGAEHHASRRAAEAAARVAARFAKAPSYNEMLASEARAAVRAAEAASRAALDAQAAAESLLAGLEAVSEDNHAWISDAAPITDAEPKSAPAASATMAASGANQGKQPFGIRWEADMPFVDAEPQAMHATHGPGLFEPAANGWTDSMLADEPGYADSGVVEPATPIHANLIEFPREIIATRKMRPRLAEAQYGAGPEAGGQLSIFEVDPGSISMQPEGSFAQAESVATPWQSPEWSDIHLDEQPMMEKAAEPATEASVAHRQLAPLGLRLMAAMIDGSLIVGISLGLARLVLDRVTTLPSLHAAELAAGMVLVGMAALYHALFFSLTSATPGMMYAQISLCTFNDECPDRHQRLGRLKALLVSVLPVGLGVAWAIFDDEHLTWHDRLSRTYLRKG